MPRRKPFNRANIQFHLAEAIEQLQKTELKASDGTLLEEQLSVELLHAYHHLNFAWNTRRISKSGLSNCTKKQFEEWSKYPGRDISEF
jgi:hypothetical protein